MNNQECKTKPETVDIDSGEPRFYPYKIKVNKCSGSCDDTNAPFSKLCVSDVVKNIKHKS